VSFGSGSSAAEGTAIFVLALDGADGTDQWVSTFDGSGEDVAHSVDVGRETLFVAGWTAGLDFGGGPVLSGSYVLALGLDGAYRWQRVFRPVPASSGSVSWAYDAVAVEGDQVAVVGSYEGTIDFGGGGLSSFLETRFGPPYPTEDLFTTLFRSDGIHLDDSSRGENDIQSAARICIGPGGAWTIVGHFSGSIDLGSGRRTAGAGASGFVARIVD
jgi:hypothetical protein